MTTPDVFEPGLTVTISCAFINDGRATLALLPGLSQHASNGEL
jgi:hypothetical protein